MISPKPDERSGDAPAMLALGASLLDAAISTTSAAEPIADA